MVNFVTVEMWHVKYPQLSFVRFNVRAIMQQHLCKITHTLIKVFQEINKIINPIVIESQI